MTFAVLLDLDGTLTDPKAGIVGSLKHAFACVGATCPSDDVLQSLIGPPLEETLPALGPDAPRILAHYRQRYREAGMYECSVFPGIPEALAELAAVGRRLLVCTSKPAVFAVEVVRHFGLGEHLEAIYGSELDGTRSDKRALLRHLVAETGIAPSDAVMVGDRKYDVAAARANGVRAIGALWGYGGAAELRVAGADVLVESPSDLPAVVDRLAAR